MKRLKNILLVVALLAAMLPCAHAGGHHGHDHDAAVELCSLDASPCECHACDHTPCPDAVQIPLEQICPMGASLPPPTLISLFVLPETKPPLKQLPPPVSGSLAIIQTVQLLI